MPPLTETQHNGEFLVSEANGSLSREVATVKQGEVLVDGQLVRLDEDGELVASEADTDGIDGVDGIFIGAADASSDGTNADIPNRPYIARLAEVSRALIHAPQGVSDATVDAALAPLFIRVREN
jgi:hypothetical protein